MCFSHEEAVHDIDVIFETLVKIHLCLTRLLLFV